MKTTMTESTKEEGKFERYMPKNPLPEEIQQMERDETVCKYCGVSYLIHNEIKALEEKLKATEAELEKLQGCEERENKLIEELDRLNEEKSDIKRNLEAKEILIATLRNNLKNEEELVAENKRLQIQAETALKLKEEYRVKHSFYQSNLPAIRNKLSEQREELQNIHAFIEKRDQQMKEEMSIMLAGIKDKCSINEKEKKELTNRINSLEREKSESTLMLTALKDKVRVKDEEIQKLSHVNDTSTQLQQTISQLQSKLTELEKELEDITEKHRHSTMENQQYKEQLRNKTKEVEDMTTTLRRKEQTMETNNKKLQNDLRQKEAELQSRLKELKDLENRFQDQRRREEEIHRKATLTVSETRELRQGLQQAKEEIEQLKSEREVMITSHQNRIEQLRESFKQKLSDAESWPEKLQEALTKERAKNATALKSMEEKLKENFVMEMTIEKEKYQELLEKYQNVNKNHEALLRKQMTSIENRYKTEIQDLQQMLADAKLRGKETEDSLRREVESLKAIIQDLEDRLARLDSGNDEVIGSLKSQMKEIHEELQNAKQELVSKQRQIVTLKEELAFLQDTVRKECEERFELTEKLSVAREELLQLKRPAGGYNSLNSSRQSTAISTSSKVRRSNSNPDTSIQADPLNNTHSPQTNNRSPNSSPEDIKPPSGPYPPKSPPKGPVREYSASTNSNSIPYRGEVAKPSGKMKGNTLEVTRKRIAAMLGRKS